MRLVVDANVLFSAYLRPSLTRKIWFDRRIELYAPSLLLEEYSKHAADLLQRSGQAPEKASRLFRLLVERLNLVKPEEIEPYRTAAEHLTIDPKDEAYLACALAVGADLWSRDRHFRQPRVRVFSTTELAQKLGLL